MKHPKLSAILTTLAVAVFVAPSSVFASTLVLSPASGTFNPGCTFSVNVLLDTKGVSTDGTDAIIFYDSSKLSVSSITNGTLYPDYPVSSGNVQPVSPDAQTVSPQASSGQISISGLASVDTPFTGSGTFATINFQVAPTAAAGQTQLNFDFDPNNPGKTTDSNVVQRGTVSDTLNNVTNGTYTIGTGTCGSAPVTNQTTGTTLTGTSGSTGPGVGGEESTDSGSLSTLPKAGDSGKTLVLTVVGSFLTVLGIAGLALL